MCKPLPGRHVLKTLRGSPKGKAQRGQYLLAVGLGRYKNGQCANEEAEPQREVDMRRCASKDTRPRRGVDLVGVPHRLEKGTSASEDTRPQRGVDCEIPHWLGRRTKDPLL